MSRASAESLRAYLENLKQKYLVPFERELAALESLAKGAQQAVSYEDYTTLISSLSILAKDHYRVGQSIYIETVEVPDLWVSGILSEFTPFVYVNDEQFVLDLNTNGHIDIGFFRLAQLETGKVNLPEYVKFTDRDTFVKGGVTKNSETLMEGEKADACEWLGARKSYLVENPTNQFRRAYIVSGTADGTAIIADRIGTFNTNSLPAYFTPTDTIANSEITVSLLTGTPELPYHSVNKKYVDEHFVAKPPSLPTLRVVVMTANNKGVDGIALAPNGYSGTYGNIPRYNNPLWDGAENEPSQQMGMLSTNYPTKKLHCANKWYVENLPDYVTFTDEQKQKWRAMLGIE